MWEFIAWPQLQHLVNVLEKRQEHSKFITSHAHTRGQSACQGAE